MSRLEKFKPVKTGVAGCGGITPSVFRGIENFTELDVIAVQDINEGAARRMASEFSIPGIHTDFSRMLEEDIELVIINTPNDCHLPMALEAFSAGRHCMVQKPLARNVAECEEMIKAAKAADRLLGVVMLERSDPIFRQMRSMNEAGCFGRITVTRGALAHTNHLKHPPSPDNWRCSPEKIGGGSFIQLAVHHLDIAQFVLDQKVVEVTALSSSMIAPDRFPVDETSGAVVKFEDGSIGQFISSFTAVMDSIELFGTGGMIGRDVEGIRWLTSEQFSGDLWDAGRVGEIKQLRMPEIANRIAELTAQYEPHRQFAHAIRGKAPLDTPGELGHQVLKVVEAVRQSAVEKRTIVIV